jgi:hypothetical protein
VDLLDATKHIDDAMLHSQAVRDSVRAALALVRATEATAQQVDRARLAKVASDLALHLTVLDQDVETHMEAIRTLRVAINVELPPPAEGTVRWYRDRMQAATKLPTQEATIKELRAIETKLQAPATKAQQGADTLLGHTRYLLAAAMRGEAEKHTGSGKRAANAVDWLRNASEKFEQVLSSPDASDTGEGTSLHAAALGSRAVIEARLYQAFLTVTPETAKRHRANAERAFEHLKKAHADARLPNGERVVDATRAAVDRTSRSSGR